MQLSDREKGKKQTIRGMELLPKELVSNVLSRLPTKDLMRCKCVCKLWFDIIIDPQFIENYYVFYNSQKEQLLLIRTPNYILGSKETDISILSWNPNDPTKLVSSRVVSNPYQYIHNTTSSNFSFTFEFWIDIMGPCNGIYFLRSNPNVIMNPSLRKFIDLPESHFTAPHGTCTSSSPHTHFPRFGFDPKTNDYKVVVLKELFLKESRKSLKGDWAIELYSLNSNSWRNLDANAIPFSFRICYSFQIFTYVNNCCHWCGCVNKFNIDEIENAVLSFDMVSERFRKIKVPETTSRFFKRVYIRNLIPCNDSTTIEVLDDYLVDQGTDKWFFFDVWMLKDYWNEESWFKRYSVGPMPVIYDFLVGCYGSNQFLWQDKNQKLVLYGPDCEERTRELLVCGHYELTRVVRYMESLVPLRKGIGV